MTKHLTLPDGGRRELPKWDIAPPTFAKRVEVPDDRPGEPFLKTQVTRRRLMQTVPLGLLAWLVDMGVPIRANATITAIAAGTTFASIRTTLTGQSAGDVAVFASGGFTSDGTPLRPRNSTHMIGQPGANITLGANGDIWHLDADGAGTNSGQNRANITIAGITHTGTASFATTNAVIFCTYPNACVFNNNTFQTLGNSANVISSFHTIGSRFDNNTFNTVQEAITMDNTSDTTTYFGISVSGNVFNLVTRNAIEIHSSPGTTNGFDGVHVIGNTIINDTNQTAGGGISISLVNDYTTTPIATTDIVCIGNDIWYNPGIAIEAAMSNSIWAYNRITDTPSGITPFAIGKGLNKWFWGNIGRNIISATMFAKDGGWVDSQWIGKNFVNGSYVDGWSFGNTAGIAPPKYTPGEMPSFMRDLNSPVPLGNFSSWLTYP